MYAPVTFVPTGFAGFGGGSAAGLRRLKAAQAATDPPAFSTALAKFAGTGSGPLGPAEVAVAEGAQAALSLCCLTMPPDGEGDRDELGTPEVKPLRLCNHLRHGRS
jgi:hypothetical protein